MTNHTQSNESQDTTIYDKLVFMNQCFVNALAHLLQEGEGILVDINEELLLVTHHNNQITVFNADDCDFGEETPRAGLLVLNKKEV